MSDDPAREQPHSSRVRAAPSRLSPVVHLSAGLLASSTLFTIITVATGAPWPAVAANAAGAIVGAAGLRWGLDRSRGGLCGRTYDLCDEPAFVCRQRARHRGDHRDGSVAWGSKSGLYEWRGPHGWRR